MLWDWVELHDYFTSNTFFHKFWIRFWCFSPTKSGLKCILMTLKKWGLAVGIIMQPCLLYVFSIFLKGLWNLDFLVVRRTVLRNVWRRNSILYTTVFERKSRWHRVRWVGYTHWKLQHPSNQIIFIFYLNFL